MRKPTTIWMTRMTFAAQHESELRTTSERAATDHRGWRGEVRGSIVGSTSLQRRQLDQDVSPTEGAQQLQPAEHIASGGGAFAADVAESRRDRLHRQGGERVDRSVAPQVAPRGDAKAERLTADVELDGSQLHEEDEDEDGVEGTLHHAVATVSEPREAEQERRGHDGVE